MKHAINPREWNFNQEETTNIWIAEDLLTLSTRVYKPEQYTRIPIVYNSTQHIHTTTSIEELAQDIEQKIREPFDEKHYQQLTITYCQIMQQLSKGK